MVTRSRIIGCARHSVARSRGQGQYYRLRALHKHVVHRGDRDQPCLLPIGYRHASTYVRIIRYIGRIGAPSRDRKVYHYGASSGVRRTKVNRELPSGGSSFSGRRIVSRNARRNSCRCPLWSP